MVIDTSALFAIYWDEPEKSAFVDAIAAAATRVMSAPTAVEVAVVALGRLGEKGLAEMEILIAKLGIETAAFSGRQAVLAIDAARRFGKGRNKAGLNLGDCYSYALAKATGEALLFKGDDFARTDITPALR